jgi:hypothetical protein
VLKPVQVSLDKFPQWARTHLTGNDQLALEATSTAWLIHDELWGWVAQVTVANSYKIQLISPSPTKTDRHDALVLAKLQAAHLLPAVWVPPVPVRALRTLVAHRQQLTRDRTAAKNRLHSILHRHNIVWPAGDPFSETNQAGWQALGLSGADCLTIRHDFCRSNRYPGGLKRLRPSWPA